MANLKNQALEICTELGFLVLPCAFNAHSTTQWVYDVYDYDEESNWYEEEGFRIKYLDIHYFFDSPEVGFLASAAPMMQVLGTLMETRLAENEHIFPKKDATEVEFLPNYEVMLKAGNAHYPAFRFLQQCAIIANAIDPINWKDYGVELSYLHDFMQYGFCIWKIEKI